MATLCDYRVMVRQNYKIGLNETWLGLVAPTFAKVFLAQLPLVMSERLPSCVPGRDGGHGWAQTG